ncbi:hypothetical protein BDV96DRAFT_625896 [Lophiotrema nucula]|uniref:Carrier domain-containing protein n=1 Tax=Lophiotrema nucula TaxID=690887 RepID=A0A6A5YH37_9PLEO|nr:hypothetical protein BDV96DRAFT_625896 [Lophiotrema nucula]
MSGQTLMDEHVHSVSGVLLDETAAVLGLGPHRIDTSASFVQLGGHSLAAAVLAAACKRRGLEKASVAAILTARSLDALAETLVLIPPTKPDPLESPDTGYLTPPADQPSPPLLSDSPTTTLPSTPPPLTELQESLLQSSLNDARTNFIYYCETHPAHAVPEIKAAWTQVIATEAIFRAQTYTASERITYRSPELPAEDLDWRETFTNDAAEYRRARTECARLFEFPGSSNPYRLNISVQFHVITFGHRQSTIIWRVHHALIDGYSAGLIFRKLRDTRQGFHVTPSPPFSAAAKALIELQQQRASAGNAFWKHRAQALRTANRELLLPSPDPIPPPSSSAYGEVVASIIAFSERAQKCAGTLAITPAAVLYAAWALVLSVYTDSDETVVGAVLSGRNLDIPHVDQVVGPLINTLPLLQKVNRADTNRDFLQATFASLGELAEYQWTTPANGFKRDFASALAVQLDLPGARDEDSGLMEPPYTKIEANIPLSVMVEGAGDVRIVYHNARYNHSDMTRLARSFCNAVDALMRPDALLQTSIDAILGTEDQAQLRWLGNCGSGLTTRRAISDDLVTLFEKAATANPHDIAVRQGDDTLTYGELDEAASQMAATLCIPPQSVVCVHAERSIAWIVSMWAILKRGGVYCPLDPALPSDMRDQIYAASGAVMYVSPTAAGLGMSPRSATAPFDAQIFGAVPGIRGRTRRSIAHRTNAEPSQPAYLCFTSGSTGRPKGVLCTHEGLVAFQRDLEVRLFAQPGRRISQFMSVAFDGSIHEIFSALCHGALLVLPNGSDPDPFAVLREVDSAILTPSIAAVLDPDDFISLETVYLVGERVPQAVADRWGAAKALYNMYGPTEGTGGATITRLWPGQSVTIGRPNPSSRIYILNQRREQVPPGAIGEVCLAGVQVARGYIGMEEETRKRFLPDPVCRGLDEHMYCTGDRGYWNSDGNLVFLGRSDRQIKLRGFRIDLEDIEARLLAACPEVKAVAIAQAADKSNPALVAMVRPSTVSIAAVRSAAVRALPVHAVPRHIIAVDTLPVTKTGKLDYAAVVAAVADSTIHPVDSPVLKSRTERRLAALWRTVLGDDDLGLPLDANSDFISLGGHSLSQLRLANQLSAAYGRKVPVRMVVECRSLRTLASALDKLVESDAPTAAPERRLGENELSPIELEWWDKYALDASSSAFNVSITSTFLPGTVNRARLTDSWNTVLAMHRILRSRYVARKRRVRRTYAASPPQVERVHEIDVWSEINRPFVLSEQDPVRVFITDAQMVVVMSHIVCDFTTMNLLLEQVSALYQGLPVPEPGAPYVDSTLWHRPAPSCHRDHWDSMYPGWSEPSKMAPGRVRTDYRGKSLVFTLDTATWHAMQRFCHQRNITYQQLVLAAVALSMGNSDNGVDMALGLPYINRNTDADLSTVGLFLEPLPVRIQYSPDTDGSTASDYLDAVQSASRKSLSFAMPWHQLLEHLHIDADYPNHPLFETMVTFHDEHSTPSPSVIPNLEPCFVWTEGSKFQLMCEFTAVSHDRLLLRIEHDSQIFSDADVLRLENNITTALDSLVHSSEADETRDRPSTERLRLDLFGIEFQLLK